MDLTERAILSASSSSSSCCKVSPVGPSRVESLHQAEVCQLEKTERRKREIEAILDNDAEKIPLYYGFRGFGGAFLGVLVVLVAFVVWPNSNPILHPHKWWECMLQCAIVAKSMPALVLITTTPTWLFVEDILSLKTFLQIYCTGATMLIIVWSTLYLVWVFALEMPYPVPLVGAFISLLPFHAMIAALWFKFPREWRRQPHFRRRMKFLVLAWKIVISLSLEYWLLGWAFFAIPKDMQWCLALILPVIREVSSWLLIKVCSKSSGRVDSSVELVANNLVLTYHSLFLAVCVGSTATDLTIYLLLSVDFAVNIYFCIKIMWLKKKGTTKKHKEECIEKLQLLVLSETLEFVVPIAYLFCFLAAYYGPNAKLLGNVKNSYWQYHANDNIDTSTANLMFLVLIDALSLVATTSALWFSCKINLFKVYLFLQKEFGLIMAIQQAYLLDYLFCTIAIGCALDLTLKFSWIDNIEEYRDLNSTQMLNGSLVSTSTPADH